MESESSEESKVKVESKNELKFSSFINSIKHEVVGCLCVGGVFGAASGFYAGEATAVVLWVFHFLVVNTC